MEKVSIYDFCETLVDFQTADRFVQYITNNEKRTSTEKIEKQRKLLQICGFIKASNLLARKTGYYVNKHMLLKELEGFTEQEIDQYARLYYEEMIRPHLINETIKMLKQDQECGYTIILISASYEPVLRHFAREYKIDELIANEFEYKDGIFTGKMKGNDCQAVEKVRRLNDRFPDLIQRAKSIKSYSDSKSDLPILSIATERYVISKNKHQKWIKGKNIKEIVWREEGMRVK